MSYRIVAIEENMSLVYIEGNPHGGSMSYSFTDDFESKYIVDFGSREDAVKVMDKWQFINTETCKYMVIEWITRNDLIQLRDSLNISFKDVLHAMTPDGNGYNFDLIRRTLGNHVKHVNRLINAVGR